MTDKASPNEYLLGAVGWQRTVNGVTGQSNTTSQTINTYDWYDGAVQDEIEYDANIYSSSNSIYTTTFTHNAQGQLVRAYIADGKPHTATFTLDELGQVIARKETSVSGQTGAPHEIWYRYGGRELGYTGNNGTSDMAMSASISERQKVTPTNQGTFRNKQLAGTAYADFAQAYDPLNSYNQGSSSGSYTVQMGDTLQSIAQGLYGDSGLWYKIAEVNGLSAYSGLIEGQRLTLPTGVMNATHNASSFKAYDPSSTLGDVNPSTNPTPQKKSNKCGTFGLVLLAVVAIAVAAVVGPAIIGHAAGTVLSSGAVATTATGLTATLGATGAGIVGGALTGAIASVASQAVGVATGIQSKFSWKSVGLAAIGGGVGGAIGPGGVFGENGAFSGISNGALQSGLRASTASAVTQGIGVATGLQSKFSWAGVAAAGAGAAASYAGLKGLGAEPLRGDGANNSIGNHLAHVGANSASLIANAATRSAIEGSSFGKNIKAALPDVIGQAISNALLSGISTPEKQVEADPVATGGGGGGFIQSSQGAMQYNKFGLSRPYNPILDQTINYWGESFLEGGLDYVLRKASAGLRVVQGVYDEYVDPVVNSVGQTIVVTANKFENYANWAIDQSVEQGRRMASNNYVTTSSSRAQAELINAQSAPRTLQAMGSAGSYLYNGTLGPNTITGKYILGPINDVVYGGAGLVANSPLGDPGVIMSLEQAQATAPAGATLAGIRGLASVGGTLRVANAASKARGISVIDDPLAVATGRVSDGETIATATGKSVHAELAAARRTSGDFDLVNSPLLHTAGGSVQVPSRVNLITGKPAAGSRLQSARPDAVSFSNRLILDDKPIGRALSKDRQEIIRFIDAYESSQGQLPSTIAIQRYNPVTGRPVMTELYKPSDFLPKGR